MHAVMPIEVVDRNLDVRATLAHGAEVDGRVVAAEGAGQPSFENIKISLRGVTPIGFSDGKPLSPDADGKFHIANAPWDGLELFISGIGSRSYYIVRYNGSAVSGNIVAFDSGPTQSMEIVVDDKPAVIAGSVTDGDKPVFQPYVVMVRWPASTEDVFSSTKNATGDEDGKFQFAGLAPGEYRVLAFSEAVKDKLDEPHVLERLLSGAEKVTLERGGFQNVALKLTNPTR
jgi:hypothetical protein